MAVTVEAKKQQVLNEINDRASLETKMAQKLLDVQLTNLQKLQKAQEEQIAKAANYKLAQEQAINERLIKMGYDAAKVVSNKTLEERLKAIDAEEKRRLAHAKKPTTINNIQKEAQAKRDAEKKFEKDKEKETQKRIKKEAEDTFKANKKYFDSLGNALFSKKRFEDAVKETTEKYIDQGMDAETAEKAARKEVKKDRSVAAAYEVEKAFANFAKQLETSINEIAHARTEIDTRLYGSNNKKFMGSYWEQMSLDVVQGVGMNPFVKQSDVVSNLKNLVGQGIAFDVEQRAFLQTISSKIATTFDATDSALVKLVRIQQADTTAARLGMEAALTEFLNSMYETTEYMQSAASEIRANLYEASALMGAGEATAFEYQVQKWMGSLYSVGFQNTSGLSGALGKLAAGDISGVTDGGYGNLFIMAANKANLSIAEILANGLDDSETNELMKAMVEYLQDIYVETKNSKVVAQQYANVFGLTASDLKAAANLYGSTETIGRNNLGYTGLIGKLQSMANTMYQRTSTGEMMTNLFDNLKYATANSIGNNPVLYSIYTLAGMLDDTAGGIAIPAISAMGSGFDLETTVADLMRVGAVGTGLLGGIGTMIAGLAMGKSANILSNFGITGNGIKTLTRGTGTGTAAISGATVSDSGLVGNSDAGDVQNATMQQANEDAGNKVAEAQDESTETKLSTVDEHIVQIFDLLDSVVHGSESLKVDMGNASAWADIMGRSGF